MSHKKEKRRKKKGDNPAAPLHDQRDQVSAECGLFNDSSSNSRRQYNRANGQQGEIGEVERRLERLLRNVSDSNCDEGDAYR
jgi:hypothetical protein